MLLQNVVRTTFVSDARRHVPSLPCSQLPYQRHPVSRPRPAAPGLESGQSGLGDGRIGSDWNVVSSPDWPGHVRIGLDTCKIEMKKYECKLGGLKLDCICVKRHVGHEKSSAKKPVIPTKTKSNKNKKLLCFGVEVVVVNKFPLGMARPGKLDT